MITKEMIARGYDKGVIKLIYDSQLHEVMCRMDGIKFSFGGYAAKEETVNSYVESNPREIIVEQIYDALEEIRNELDYDEYIRYENYLRNRGC